MSNEICQVDFHDAAGSGLLFKAGTYTRSFRELCRRDEAKHRAERERQEAGLAVWQRQGLNRLSVAPKRPAENHPGNDCPADDNGFCDYLRHLNGDGANGDDGSADYFGQFEGG